MTTAYRASRVTEVMSRSRSILASTFASCCNEVTLKVAVMVAVPSGWVATAAATMLTLYSATTLVTSFSSPGRSSAEMRTVIG